MVLDMLEVVGGSSVSLRKLLVSSLTEFAILMIMALLSLLRLLCLFSRDLICSILLAIMSLNVTNRSLSKMGLSVSVMLSGDKLRWMSVSEEFSKGVGDDVPEAVDIMCVVGYVCTREGTGTHRFSGAERSGADPGPGDTSTTS